MPAQGAQYAAPVAFARAGAQDNPNSPVRIIQGFAPRGNANAIARILGQEMSKSLGHASPGIGVVK